MDYQTTHQFVCKQAKGSNVVVINAKLVKEVEKSTPFLKSGSLVASEEVMEESLFASMQLQDLTILKEPLGKGSYGLVQQAEHKHLGKKFAIKRIDKESLKHARVHEAFLREVSIHKKLKHQYIVRLYTSLEDDYYIYLVLELVAKGNLF